MEQIFRVQTTRDARGPAFMIYNKTRSVLLQGRGKGTEALQRFLSGKDRDYCFGKLPIGARSVSQLRILRPAFWQGW